MAAVKKDGSVELHLRFYPEKYKAHKIFVEQLNKYQEALGVGPSDALATMLCDKKESILESIAEKKEHKQEEPSGGTGKQEEHTKKPDPEAGSPPPDPAGYEESGFLGLDSDFYGGNL